MARGWESKSVESQLETKEAVTESQGTQGKNQKSAEDIRREHERRGLQISRKRILNDLETATHPNHRKSLEAALAFLDKKLSELN